jgi:cyanophycinase
MMACMVNQPAARTLAALLSLLPATAIAQAIDPSGVSGTRILGGGGKLPASIYERFVSLAGGKDARIVLVPTASKRADNPSDRERLLARWQESHPDAHFEVLHTRDRTVADSEQFIAPLRGATGIWFGGGSQSRIAKAYISTRFEDEMHSLLKRGGVVGGSSAGAAIQTRVMIAGGKEQPDLKRGFDLLPLAIVDQHFLARGRLPRLLQAVDQNPGWFGLGIDEGTAVIVQGRKIEVLGDSKALFVLPKTATKPQTITELSAGDRADLTTWQRAARQRATREWPPSKASPPIVASGAVLLGGGGALPDSVFEQFIRLAGGTGARVLLVPTASPSTGRRSDYVGRKLRQLGVAKLETLDPEHPDQVTPEHIDQIDRATGVWFGGGRQWRIVDAFEGTKVPAAFRRVLKRGGVIGGSSAGATIQGEFLVRGDPLGNRNMWCEGYDQGFGFLPGCAVDQHFLARNRVQDLQQLIQTVPQFIGIGIDEGTAAVIQKGVLRVVGRSKVAVFDSRIEPIQIKPIWLDPGDRWDLVRRDRPPR